MSSTFPFASRNAPEPLIAGFGGTTRHGSAALTDGKRVLGICEQERATRVRAAGFNSTGLPDEALDLLLARLGQTRRAVGRYIVASNEIDSKVTNTEGMDRHLAHACTSYLSSGLQSAAIVVCDHRAPKVSVWRGFDNQVTSTDWPWTGIGFSDLYSACAESLRLGGAGDQRFEALARLAPEHRESWLDDLFNTDGTALILAEGWQSRVETWHLAANSAGPIAASAPHAAGLQRRIGELLLTFLTQVRKVTGSDSLCLGGDLFYHSSINTFVRSSGLFSTVFVPVDPGDAGLAVGAALHHSRGSQRERLSAFAGPSYSSDEIKATLDNCKVSYTLLTEQQTLEAAASALQHGRLVGWYEGAMEWGPRALGARSILANPFAPYVLENLNRFLKHREPWRGYALSVLKSAAEKHFDGPAEAPFMECDFKSRDETFRGVLPQPESAVRLHIADSSSPPRFRRLLEAFGTMSGVSCVVNTSFNGFHEPIVCSPRDAIRVFYSSGVDLLLLDRFLISK